MERRCFGWVFNRKWWIKINSDYKEVNVQNLEKKKNSILQNYKELIELRNREKALQYGKYDKLEYADNQISFTRSFDGDTITTIINFGTENVVELPAGAKVLMGNNLLIKNSFIIYKN